jgi:hypothetical protein
MKKLKYILVLLIFSLSFTSVYSFEIPSGVPAGDTLARMGYLDVTLYGADPTGKTISTKQIREAIRDAQKHQMACYFPSGTYLVDDSLNGVLRVHPNPKFKPGDHFRHRFISEMDYPVYLVGAATPRPVIKLIENAKSYGDPKDPKPVFWLWAQNRGNQHPETAGSLNPRHQQSNIGFNMVLQNFIIDLGENKGAEGVRFAGAQGSVVEDVTVLAKGAFSGFHSCVGQGGGMYNIEVIDGQHGMVITDGAQSKFPVIAGAVFKNQQQEVFKLDQILTPMVVVGFYIEKESGSINSGWPANGLSLIDGVVKYKNPGKNTVLSGADNNLFLKNVYVSGNGILMSDDPKGSELLHDQWNHVLEYNYSNEVGKRLINGVVSKNTSTMKLEPAQQVPSANDFRKKHTWNPDELIHIGMRNDADFIHVADESKYRVPGAPKPANGDDDLDDTEAIQWAIDHYDKVFIPKGTFLISAPLQLKSKTQLSGAGKTYSYLLANDNWQEGKEHVMIKTPADPEATTLISFLNLRINIHVHHDMTRVEWKTGKHSMIKDMRVTSNHAPVTDHKLFSTLKITGPTSGGRIYGWIGHGDGKLSSNPGFRDILVDGSEQGLSFYGVNTERSYSDVQFEIKDTKNVDIYFFKSESGGPNGRGGITNPSTPLRISRSGNIFHTCTTGVLQMLEGKAIVEVNNCENVTVSNIKSFFDVTRNNQEWYLIKENFNGKTHVVKADEEIRLVLFRRE